MTKEAELILDDLYARGFNDCLFADCQKADSLPCTVSVVKKTSGFYRVQYGLFVEEKQGVYGVECVACVTKNGDVHWGIAESIGFKPKSARRLATLAGLKEWIACKELTEGKEAIGFSWSVGDFLTLQKEGEEIY